MALENAISDGSVREDLSRGRPTVLPVHIVTVLYNSADHLRPFLDSLLAQDLRAWRLWAIDNASADATCQIVGAVEDARITLVRNPDNRGFAKATNQGLELAAGSGGQFFIIFNNDTTFAPDFLARLVEVRDRLGADVIAPRIMLADRPEEAWFAGARFARGWLFDAVTELYDPSDMAEWRHVECAPGCCLGITLGVLQTVGLLDESFFVYWEDADFCLRLGASGIPIFYVREPTLSHVAQGSFGGEFTVAANRLFYKSYILALRKYFGLRYAMRAIVRILLRDRERKRLSRRRDSPASAVIAMLSGLVAPLVPVRRLKG
jgi:GT2 family glycosyltransferase